MNTKNLISEVLDHRTSSISYNMSNELAELFPDRYILETESEHFDLAEFVRDGHCEASAGLGAHSQYLCNWRSHSDKVRYGAVQAMQRVTWSGHEVDVFQMTWPQGYCDKNVSWIVASNSEIAEEFFRSVCRWCSGLRGEVLVFEQGYWHKSKELFRSISNSSYDHIILAGDLKKQIHDDIARFLASRETYNRFGVPWKRGTLFIGPPGNGKTQMVKAVINAVKTNCLYVKSFTSQHGDDNRNVRMVFDRAREMTPCILVMEDLDSLVDSGNRSFFLNELDGFAANTGILVLATTNHPDRLDPAIMDRPSRFDRKYHFNLPEIAERAAYLELWNANLDEQLKLTTDGISQIAAATESFSFAYLKELMLASVMNWIDRSEAGAMGHIANEQALALREQMAYASEPISALDNILDQSDEASEMLSMMRRARGRRR